LSGYGVGPFINGTGPKLVRESGQDRVLDSRADDRFEDVTAPVAMLRHPIQAAGRTGWPRHRRSQLLYATSGLMVVTTDHDVWMVPTGHALLIAPGVPHDSACQGPLGLCTAYVEPTAIGGCVVAGGCRMVRVSALLDAALRELAAEEGEYDPQGRTGLLTRVVVDEIERAEDAAFALPMPDDPRLRRICDALITTPADDRDIDAWAVEVGLSRRTLTRRFRAETSLSFAEWRRRLRAARALIRQSEGAPLTAAAGAVGYRSAQSLRAMLERTSQRDAFR
jgi:AraC-like DNA-binding protein/mannose-6-phosphate isomerase-like protein (cupin superfamily)